ncbi:polysaccharide pyruvyl transferase family protein [Actinoalloteichus spitiensis]|uniref:polysaccharide pyruvyl transferase family protein n=1 Tax=Actinoalloteichus spitiensis TaxID=252394 RepID=UPI00036298BA|nr:polysaccharide pyruvyl transferase family protein [Actinoalloteichus spitiensis]
MSESDRALYYLIGTTGFPNYGDEMIAATWLRHLRQVAPDADVWLDCPSPGPAQVLLGHLHPRARFTDTLWRLCWEAPGEEPWQVNEFAQRAVNDPGMAPRWAAGIQLAHRADVLHIIGGGYVNGVWPRHVGLLAGMVSVARRSGARTAMTGVGLWPAPEHGETLIRELANRFDVVDVRDAPSARLLEKAGAVSHTCDDLFFDLGPHLYRADELREFMVCVQSDLLRVSVPALAAFVTDTLRAWDVPPDRLGFVECIPRVDRDVFALVESEFPGVRMYPLAEVLDHGMPAAAGQTWLSTRFHPHLVGAAVGANGVAVSVNPDYYATKHRSLTDLGSGWTLVENLEEIPTRPVHGGYSPESLAEYRAAKRRVADRIYPYRR